MKCLHSSSVVNGVAQVPELKYINFDARSQRILEATLANIYIYQYIHRKNILYIYFIVNSSLALNINNLRYIPVPL